MVRNDKCKLGVARHEEKKNKRIWQSDDESRETIVKQWAFVSAYMNLLGRIAAETVVSESEKQEASEYLQIETVLMIGDEIHHEAHAEASNHCVEDVTTCCSDTCDEAKPASFIYSTLYTKNAYRTHWRWSHNADKHTF